MSLLGNLPHRCTAKIRVRSEMDEYGGTSDEFEDVFTDRECWMQPAQDREIDEFDKRGISVTHAIYFNSDPGIDERNILVIDSDTFEVRSRAPDSSAGMDILFKVMVEITTTGSTPDFTPTAQSKSAGGGGSTSEATVPATPIGTNGGGYMSVFDPWSDTDFSALNPNNTNPVHNDAQLQKMWRESQNPLMIDKGIIAISDIIDDNGYQACPEIRSAGITIQADDATAAENSLPASGQIRWHGEPGKPMFRMHGVGGMISAFLYGKASPNADKSTRASCGVQIGRIDGDRYGAGKSMFPWLTVEECDIGMLGGIKDEPDFNGDNVLIGKFNARRCRIPFQLTKQQNKGWYFDEFRTQECEEVNLNILAGGPVVIKSGKQISNNTIWLKLGPNDKDGDFPTDKIGSGNGNYWIELVTQDGNALNSIWLADYVIGGAHQVVFNGIAFHDDGVNHIRINGSGLCRLMGCFQTGSLHDRIYMRGDGIEVAKLVNDGSDGNPINNLMAGSGKYSVAETFSWGQSVLRGATAPITNTSAPTGDAAWDALSIISKYSGPGHADLVEQ